MKPLLALAIPVMKMRLNLTSTTICNRNLSLTFFLNVKARIRERALEMVFAVLGDQFRTANF